MFLKTTLLKQIMKNSLKRSGLIVGNYNGNYVVYTEAWGVCVSHEYASNKFKAAIMELIGDLPEESECYHYTVEDKNIAQDAVWSPVHPYEDWKQARDSAIVTPVNVIIWPHEYVLFQMKRNLEYIGIQRTYIDVMSVSELEPAEHMPGDPSVRLGRALYFKNDCMIYWVSSEDLGEKAEETIIPALCGLDFSQKDWKYQAEEPEKEPEEEEEEASAEELPY